MYFFFCMGAIDTVMGWFSGSAAAPVVGVAVAVVSIVDFGVVALSVTLLPDPEPFSSS